MLWSGSSLSVMRDSMWGFLLFAGVAWLAIGWSVLRLEPAGVVAVAGPVVLFGALCEALRALAGTRTWWLNAGMATLFVATGVVLLTARDATYATPASLVGWYLMVRGAMDVAVSTMNRVTDRTWGLLMALGVAQAGLGFYAAGPLARSADPMVLLLGGMGLLRAVADLVTALRLREVSGVRHEVLRLPPEREEGVAGYSAGRTDFEAQPPSGRPKHRADGLKTDGLKADGPKTDGPKADGPKTDGPKTDGPKTFHDEVVRTTKDLDSMIAQAGVTGTAEAAHRVSEDLPPAPDTPEGAADSAAVGEEKRH